MCLAVQRCSLCLLFGALAFAQAPGAAPHLRVGPVYTAEFPNLDIVVEAGAGSAATASINAADLILTEEGVRTSTAQGMRKFSETGQGVAVLLALDASGSMRGKPLDAVHKGLGQFVSKARDNDKIGVLSFADDVRWETQWSGSREETRQKLEAIQARGRTTVLWVAVDTALDELAKLDGPSRRHLVVISDGHDEGSMKTLAEVIAKAVSLRIPVDTIGMTRSNPRYLENLQALSAQSKGSYTRAPDLNALTELVGGAIGTMLDTPVARFKVEKLKADGSPHRVGVYWKAADKEDETSVALPSATQLQQQQTPTTQTQPNQRPARRRFFRWWYVAVALGVGVLVFVILIMLNRRQAAATAQPIPPVPAPAPYASPNQWPPAPVPSPIPAPMPAQNAAPSPEPWLPAPMPPSPVPPAPVPLAPKPAPSAPVAIPPQPRPRPRTQFAAAFGPPVLLIGKSGPAAGKTTRIEASDFWIGAAENNHLQLHDNTVSANHAYFRFESETLKIFDNHSTNDTWVNRQAIGDTARVLFPGDEIQIGRSVFVIERSNGETTGNLAQSGPPFALPD